MGNRELEQLRKEVEEVNLKLLELINKRGELVQEIGKLKEAQGVSRYDPIREREMLNAIKEHHDGRLKRLPLNIYLKRFLKRP